jgi:hypothetical protein
MAAPSVRRRSGGKWRSVTLAIVSIRPYLRALRFLIAAVPVIVIPLAFRRAAACAGHSAHLPTSHSRRTTGLSSPFWIGDHGDLVSGLKRRNRAMARLGRVPPKHHQHYHSLFRLYDSVFSESGASERSPRPQISGIRVDYN